MDQAIIKYYRQLLKTDFQNSGPLENASIFVEAIGEKMVHCGNSGNYMQLYLNVADRKIADIKYLCSCEPTANVAVEALCTLVKEKSLDEALSVPEEALYEFIGCNADELKIKVRGLLEMLHEGIAGYTAKTLASISAAENVQW